MPQAKKKTSAKKKTATKVVKKSAPKVAAKKVTKKIAKKVVAKAAVKKKAVAKKVVKKAAAPVVEKKLPKKAAPKPPIKTAKAAAPKVLAPKAVAPKPAAKKVAAKPAAKATPAKAAAPAAKAVEVKPMAAKSKPVKATAPAPKAKSRPSNVATTERVAGGLSPYDIKSNEEYMNEAQVAHFRAILNAWKRELMEEVDRTVHHMQDDAANFPDPSDRATQESEFSLELRARDRERKLIKKIDESLLALDNNEYGYCETCGVEIGIRRLEARPTATLCIDCKTLDEIREKQRA